MGLIKWVQQHVDGIKQYFDRRKQRKLDKAREEKIENFNERILDEVEAILNNEVYANDNKKYEAIYRILKKYEREAVSLEIIKQGEINRLTEHFIGNIDIQNAINFARKSEFEERIIMSLNYGIDIEKFGSLVNEYLNEFCTDENKFKVFTEKEKFEMIQKILQDGVTGDTFEEKLRILNRVYRNNYLERIIHGTNPQEVINSYEEYIQLFLNGTFELEEEFRQEFAGEEDFLRRIDLLRELDSGMRFESMDVVPVFYDMTKERVDDTRNEKIAEEKANTDVTAQDLVFIRTTQVFPKDGVVEPTGEYSELETVGNPFMEVLRKIDPSFKEDDYQVMCPRFRWTSHWCVNGLVGTHTMGDFSGRDFFLIEDATERINDECLINTLVADVIYLGDMKLSPKAKIMMDIEKYRELMQNPKMKKQLSRINVILYRGNPEDALKIYMNEKGYVWGTISAFNYAQGRGNSPSDEYLSKIESSLRAGRVKGFEHSGYSSDEGLSASGIRNSEVVRNKFRETSVETQKMLGVKEEIPDFDNRTICAMSTLIDQRLTYNVFDRYIEYLRGIFPEMQGLAQEFVKARRGEYDEAERFFDLSEPIIRRIDKAQIRMATKKFNEIMMEEQRRARAKKDKELLERGLITQEEYNDRTTTAGQMIAESKE